MSEGRHDKPPTGPKGDPPTAGGQDPDNRSGVRAPNLDWDDDNWDDATAIEDEQDVHTSQTGTPNHPLSPTFPAVDTYGRYEILGRLAVGGMAEVFLARDVGPHNTIRHVAIKRILPQIADDETFVEMFLDEARLAVQLNHPTICHIYDFGELEDTYFIAMEWVNGVPLGKLIKRAKEGGGIPVPVACRIIAQISEALNYAHQARDGLGRPMNIVHRDVSPQNIMTRYDGVVKLLDFGIAKAATQSNVTEAGVVKGKFSYMSPEQCLGRPLDARSDIFSLGACLYEAITTKSPFRRNSDLDTMRAIVHEPAQSPRLMRPEVPETLDNIVRKALAKDPGQRFQTAGDVYVALERFLSEQGEFVRAMHIAKYIEKALPEESATGPLSGSNPSGQALALGSGSRRSAAATTPVGVEHVSINEGADSGTRPKAPPSEPDTIDVHIPSTEELQVFGNASDLLPIDEDDDPTIADLDPEAVLAGLEITTNEVGGPALRSSVDSNIITMEVQDEGPTTPKMQREAAGLAPPIEVHEAETMLREPTNDEAGAIAGGRRPVDPLVGRFRRMPLLLPLGIALLVGLAVGVVLAVNSSSEDEPTGEVVTVGPTGAITGEPTGTAAGEGANEPTGTAAGEGEGETEGEAEGETEAEAAALAEAEAAAAAEAEAAAAAEAEAAAAAEAAAEAEAEVGTLVVRSTPRGATVRVHGRERMEAPATLDDLPPAAYEVIVTKRGYERWTERVMIRAGETETVHAELRRLRRSGTVRMTVPTPRMMVSPRMSTARATGRLTVATQPAARVYIGGRFLGRTPLRNASVPAGPVRLRLVTPDGRSHTRSVRIRAGESNRAFFSLR